MKIIDGNKRRNRTKKKKQNKNKAKRNKTKAKQKEQQKTTKQTFNATKHAEFLFVVFHISAKNNTSVYTGCNNKQNYHLMSS
jgi:hypothetical protein